MIYKKLILDKNQKVYFTSDTHYGHKNICKGTTEWDLEDENGTLSTRNFQTLKQMDDCLIDSINKYVKEDDYLIHLGDWSFGGIQNIWNFRKRIKCKNIIIILGNHDHHIANKKTLPNCWVRYKDGKYVSIDESTSDWDELANTQEIFNFEVYSYLELTVSSKKGKQTYNLMHFPISVWNKAHHNRVMLHGHTHGSFQHEGRSLDVGVDNAFKLFGEYRPFSQEDINNFMNNRKFKQFSHHNKNTN